LKKTILLVLLLVCSSFVFASPYDTGLLAYYKFDNENNLFEESTSNSYDGTNNGATYNSSGKINGAVVFDENDYGLVSNDSFKFDGADDNFTISLWTKGTSDSGAFLSIQDGNDDGWNLRYVSGKVWLQYDAYDVKTSSSVNDGSWHHIVAVIDKTNGGQMYVDGSADGSLLTSVIGKTLSLASNDLYFGKFSFTPLYLDAFVDEIAIFNRTLSVSEIEEIYNNGAGLSYSDSSLVIERINQSPADLDTNIFDQETDKLVVNYNVTSNEGINDSTVLLNYWVNTTLGPWYSINGTSYYDERNTAYTTKTGSVYEFELDVDYVYPHTGLRDHEWFGDKPHESFNFGGNSELVKIEVLNVSSQDSFAYFEFMGNSSQTGSLTVYACNSSYITGSPDNIGDCGIISTVDGVGTYNHVHGNYSAHQVLPFEIVNGSVAGISVTSEMYFLGKSKSGSWEAWYVNQSTRSGSTQYSTTNGNTWVDVNGGSATWDAHLHQFTGNDTFRYYASAIDNASNSANSTTSEDVIGLGNQPPSSPIVYNPSGVYVPTDTMVINYSAGTSPNDYDISYYNISLYNGDGTFNQTINESVTGLTYNWTVPDYEGIFIVRVVAVDEINQSSFGESDLFSIGNPIVSVFNILTSPTRLVFILVILIMLVLTI